MNQPPTDDRTSSEKGQSFQPLLFTRPERAEELQEAVSTTTALPPPPARPAGTMTRAASDSHVRLCVQDLSLPDATEREAQDLLDELCEEQLTLNVDLACLEESLALAPRARAASSAGDRMLDGRFADLCALRDALADVQLGFVDSRLPRILVPDSALAEYLRGIYAWTDAVVRVLEGFARSERASTDWALAGCRLEEAKNFHFDELHEAIRADLLAFTILSGEATTSKGPAARSPLEIMQRSVERLLATALAFEAGVDKAFG